MTMPGEIDAAGDIATGTLAAHAVEPDTGIAGREEGEAVCLNCGTGLSGAYCHRCGQPAHVHRSIRGLLHDVAHGVFHFEGKIWDTLPLLAWHPGLLTRRYIVGERAKFISPLALFLFSIFLLFAAFSLVGGPFTPRLETPTNSHVARQLAAERRDALAALGKREAARAAAAKRDTAPVDPALGEARRRLKAVDTAQSTNQMGKGGSIEIKTGWPVLDEAVRHANENPRLLLYKIQSSAYKFAWVLIPISVPFIWLLFAFRRDVGLYDHAIFAAYSLSAMILLVIALSLAAAIGLSAGWILLALLVMPPLHMYRQLKEAYALTRAGALWRTFALLVGSYAAVLLFFLMLLAMGLAG
jgi:hypothetical protein